MNHSMFCNGIHGLCLLVSTLAGAQASAQLKSFPVPSTFTDCVKPFQNTFRANQCLNTAGVPVLVDPSKSLFINALSVVNDPRASNVGRTEPGPWSFGYLLRQMLPPANPVDPVGAIETDRFVRDWISQWKTSQVNYRKVRTRPSITSNLLAQWPKKAVACQEAARDLVDPALQCAMSGASCICQTLDLLKAPARLLAIVYRPDLRSDSQGGEGRFVFQLTHAAASQFTVIFEFALPTNAAQSPQSWAGFFQNLSSQAFGPSFNANLEIITRGFSDRNRMPGRPAGNPINQIRTNELALASSVWELREFKLNSLGRLQLDTTKQNPHDDFQEVQSKADELNRWVLAAIRPDVFENRDAICADRHQLPQSYLGSQAKESGLKTLANLGPNAASFPNLKGHFGMATCNGCHFNNGQENLGTAFLHVSLRALTAVSRPSAFTENDLVRRANHVKCLLNSDCCASEAAIADAQVVSVPSAARSSKSQPARPIQTIFESTDPQSGRVH